jgi:hypothetical protein
MMLQVLSAVAMAGHARMALEPRTTRRGKPMHSVPPAPAEVSLTADWCTFKALIQVRQPMLRPAFRMIFVSPRTKQFYVALQ